MKPGHPISRRDTLLAAGAATIAASMGGCEKLISRATQQLGESLPAAVSPPAGPEIDPFHHLLNRAAFGPWPGDLATAREMGQAAWIDQQLHPESIEDHVCDLRARRFEELEQPAGECFEYDKPVLRRDMAQHALLRALYSKRQLYEVMVGFWTDHLNINIEKGDCIYLKPSDDREVIRKHALGKFRDLIRASATSPAMLVYLDGNQNRRAKPSDIPNENYGRELLELHTLGVNGGYTQADVYEAARCLTGWHVKTGFRKGTVFFDPKQHDQLPKQVLGSVIDNKDPAQDIEQLIDIVARHPSTSRHIATKLVRRFVSDDPPQTLVEKVAGTFRNSDGDIRATVRAVLDSDEFRASAGQKFKTPFRFVVSALRAVGADTFAHDPLIEYLARMGQGVFQYPTPDGYPDKAAPLMATLLWRWNLAFAAASNTLPSVNVSIDKLVTAIGGNAAVPSDAAQKLFRHLNGRDADAQQLQALGSIINPNDLTALIISSPAFQRC
jgi:uncharacterized protein (DUF1800 family)